MDGRILSGLETISSALSDSTRLRLLNLMVDGEVCVCFFTEVLGESQPKVSRHLAYLRKSGLVQARRDGKWMHYSIKFPEEVQLRRVLEEALNALGSEEELVNEREQLVKVSLSATAPVTITRAPKPAAAGHDEIRRSKDTETTKRQPAQQAEEIETYLL